MCMYNNIFENDRNTLHIFMDILFYYLKIKRVQEFSATVLCGVSITSVDKNYLCDRLTIYVYGYIDSSSTQRSKAKRWTLFGHTIERSPKVYNLCHLRHWLNADKKIQNTAVNQTYSKLHTNVLVADHICLEFAELLYFDLLVAHIYLMVPRILLQSGLEGDHNRCPEWSRGVDSNRLTPPNAPLLLSPTRTD